MEKIESKDFMGYTIFSDGKILTKKGIFLKLSKGCNPYFQVNLHKDGKQKTFLLHRLLAILFIPNPENKAEVNHIDGNKENNSLSNLEWCTRSENIQHGVDTGLIPNSMTARTGKKHWRSRPIEARDKEDNLIHSYDNCAEAERIDGYNKQSVAQAVRGVLKTYKGLIWSRVVLDNKNGGQK